jgi:hypothetical protein
MIYAIATSTRGLMCKSSAMLRTITPKLRAVGLPDGWAGQRHEIPALTAGFSWLYFKHD